MAEGLLLARTQMADRWGFEVDQRRHPVFHFLMERRAVLHQGDTRVELSVGDVVILPQGSGHKVVREQGAETIALSDFLAKEPRPVRSGERADLLYCGNSCPRAP